MYVLCVIYISLAAEATDYLYIKLYPTFNIMCYLFVIYILQPTNCNLTAKYVSADKTATKVFLKLSAAAISVSFSCTIFFSPSSYDLLKSLNLVNPQYRCCLRQQLTPLKTLDLCMTITGINHIKNKNKETS